MTLPHFPRVFPNVVSMLERARESYEEGQDSHPSFEDVTAEAFGKAERA
jgi:hypothetical protein